MKRYFWTINKRRQYLLLGTDLALLTFSVVATSIMRCCFPDLSRPNTARVLEALNLWPLLTIPGYIFFMYLFDSYNINRYIFGNRHGFRETIVKPWISVLASVLAVSCIEAAVLFFFPKYIIGRQILMIHAAVSALLLMAWRWIFFSVLMRNIKQAKLALAGSETAISLFADELAKWPNSGFEISNRFPLNGSNGHLAGIPDLINGNGFHALAINMTGIELKNSDVQKVLRLKGQGRAVYDMATLYENLFGKVPPEAIDGRWLMQLGGFQGAESKLYARTKRVVDILIASSALTLTWPIFLLVALSVKLTSRGPILFKQMRLGANGTTFRCMKFRTMVDNAERATGPVWTGKDDPRVTTVGRLLRKSRLDELPQLFNILKGEMSFVGPRPIRKHFADILAQQIPFYNLRFTVKPGLTGWAQVKHDYAGTDEGQREKFAYELFYIERMSLPLDVFILLKTVQSFVFGKGQ